MFRHLFVSAACLTVLGACDDGGVRISSRTVSSEGGVLKVVDALQCPETVGGLTRKGSASGDGLVCNYTGPRGAEVSLHLVQLGSTSVDEVLADFESRLAADLPEAAARVSAQSRQSDSGPGLPEPASTDGSSPAHPDVSSSRTAKVTAPGISVEARDDRSSVRLPGIQIDTDGDHANVRIGGMHINAADGQPTQVRAPSVSINASDKATEVRASEHGDAVRAHYILTDSIPRPGGWALVGYEARGPRVGPIVVATVRAKEGNRDSVFEDARELVTLNVGR